MLITIERNNTSAGAAILCPIAGGSGPWDIGPEPAPTGDGCYFGYGPNVYDACEDHWFDYGRSARWTGGVG